MSKATTAERALNRKGGTMSRLIKTLFGFYPVLLPLVVVGVVLCAIINSIGATFLQSALQIISESWQSGDWEAAQPKIAQLVTTLACIYGVGILSTDAFAVVKDAGSISSPEKRIELEKAVFKQVDDSLGAIARPSRVHFLTILPKTRSGKLLRRSIQALAEGRDPGDLTTIEDPAALEQLQLALSSKAA